MMFYVSVLSFISVVLGCLGTCMPCCGWIGSCAHFIVNCAYVVLIIFGSVYRFSASGAICSGDMIKWGADEKEFNANQDFTGVANAPAWAVSSTDKWQYWASSGGFMKFILIIQYITIACMCCCSCCLSCKNKKD